MCNQKRALVVHHFRGRDVPDWDKPWNKGYICAACHDDVHSGKSIIEGWVQTTEGKILAWHKAGEPAQFLDDANAPLYKKEV
jgi:hypothetical protein